MKPNEIRQMTSDEIHLEVDKLRQELLDLRIQAAVGHASNPRRIRTARREIARLLTIADEKAEETTR
jgi:large subunit ribosomal protein L29